MTNTSKKVLVPLATLLAAGAVAVGSGATFTSTTNNAISSVTAGKLVHTNDKANAAIFTITKLKPGQSQSGSVTITNTGDLASTLKLTETSSTNAFTTGSLRLKITEDGVSTPVYDGEFGGLVDGVATELDSLDVDATRTFTFTVTLDQNAPNGDQGKTADAAYQWVTTQR